MDDTGNTSELVLCPLSLVHQGHYICRVNHGENCIFSQWTHVSVVTSAGSSPGILTSSLSLPFLCFISSHVNVMSSVSEGCSSSLFPGSVSGLRITHQPQSQAVSEGDTLVLECKAVANPPAQYKWYHNMVLMPQHITCSVKVFDFV